MHPMDFISLTKGQKRDYNSKELKEMFHLLRPVHVFTLSGRYCAFRPAHGARPEPHVLADRAARKECARLCLASQSVSQPASQPKNPVGFCAR